MSLRDLGIVAAVKAAIGGLVLYGGFRAVSDDDFARVVHAQEWALSPALDPTGTSWLPLPFWLNGGAMMLLGTSIETARVMAFVAGIASALLIYAAARLLTKDALLGAIIAVSIPWSARLGVATVPELPTAALTLFAIATLLDEKWRRLGALALMAACLSRYEPWPVAAVFALYCLRDRRFVSAAMAVGAPLAWLAHNALAHGSALHFLHRVSAYKQALGETSSLAGYPLSLLREEPELCLLVLVVSSAVAWRRYARVMACVLSLLVILTAASLPGGAPTHHAGRALLVIWLALAVVSAPAIRKLAKRPPFAALMATALIVGAFVLRPWYARLDSFVDRPAELAVGREAAARVPATERVLIEVHDYAYFAIQAGSGDPRRFVLDRDPDPRREPQDNSFTDPDKLRARAQAVGARWVIARGPKLLRL